MRKLTSACSEYKKTLEAPICAARSKMFDRYVEFPFSIVVELVPIVPFIPEIVEFVKSVELLPIVEFVRVEFEAMVPFESKGKVRVA